MSGCSGGGLSSGKSTNKYANHPHYTLCKGSSILRQGSPQLELKPIKTYVSRKESFLISLHRHLTYNWSEPNIALFVAVLSGKAAIPIHSAFHTLLSIVSNPVSSPVPYPGPYPVSYPASYPAKLCSRSHAGVSKDTLKL